MNDSLESLLDQALELHQLGRLFDAQRLYTKILRKSPMHFDVLHMLGVSYIQTKEHQKGIPAIQKAILVKPDAAEAHFNLGNAYRELQQFEAAISSYQKAILISPDFADAYNNLGNSFKDNQQFDEAIACFKQTLLINPHYCDAQNNLGVIYGALKQFDNAVAAYTEAVTINPDYAEAYYNLGVLYSDLKQYGDAIACYNRVLMINPHYVEAHYNLGVVRSYLKQYDDAIACYQQAISNNPYHVDAHFNKGIAHSYLKQYAEAAACFKQVVSIKPDHADAQFKLGNALSNLKQFKESIAHYQQAILLKPDVADGPNNLGVVYSELKRYDEALMCYQHATRIDPKFAEAHYNMGVMCNELAKFDDAISCYKKAVALQPDHAEAIYNTGVTLAELRRFDAALECYERALTLNPNLVDAQFNRGIIFLYLGKFEFGWRDYELRWQCRNAIAMARPSYPCWIGEHEISGKRLLIQYEQGLGDGMQMLRYVPFLEAQGIECWIQTPAPLTQLFNRSFPNAKLVDTDIFPEALDFYIPLMSLPLAMKTFAEGLIPNSVPYLKADPVRCSYWNKRLNEMTVSVVGLVWRGNPNNKNDRNRSAKLADYMPLITTNPNICFISMQKGLTEQERCLLRANTNVSILDEELTDFDETAAVVSNLDMLITIDSAPAHLAGALAIPVWILLPFGGEWRWLNDRADSPWYPSAVLFQQQKLGEWDGVVSCVNESLSSLGEVVYE